MVKFLVSLGCFFNSLSAEQFDLVPMANWLESQSTIKSVQADFIQRRKLKTLEREILTEGKLWVAYPDKFHWQMGIPAKALILRNGERMQFQNLKTKSIDNFGVKSEQGRRFSFMTSQFAHSLDAFQKSFEIKKVWEEKGVYYCLFRSRNRTLRNKVPYLAVGIFKKTNKIAFFEMHLEDKSVIRTTFKTYQINSEVDPKKFILLN